MADKKISALTASTTPLAGTEVLPIVQSGATVKVAVSDLTAGRAISATQLTLSTENLVIGTAGKGIDFSAATHAAGMTSELLNDYEEGTWTATISDGTTDATMNAGRRTGTYTKVGRQVTVTGYIATTSMTGVTGNLRMKGLPFTAGNNDVGGGAVGYCDGSMTFASGNVMTLQTQNGADYIVIRYWSGASGTVNMPGTLWGAAGEIGFTLTYFV